MNSTNDLRYAFRVIRNNPWFSAAIIATLALGIGVNTTVFSLANAVLYKPLPFPGGGRLVIVSAAVPSKGRDFVTLSYADFRDFRDGAKSFERLEAVASEPMAVSERGNPAQRYQGLRISAGLFEMISTQPVLGRNFRRSDEKRGAEAVVSGAPSSGAQNPAAAEGRRCRDDIYPFISSCRARLPKGQLQYNGS